jgi:hypothetical protein|tara:strand:+ start:1065 stop:1712 length:648 start_codon:yes stop_codon:yes gene_type:complete
MATIIITPKVAKFGVLAELPSVDVATVCPAVTPNFYTVNLPVLSPSVTTGEFIIIKISLQNAGGATNRTVRIIRADGTALLTFAPVVQPALPLLATTIYSQRAFVRNAADWQNVSVQVGSTTAGDSVVVKANSLVFSFAESCNITDEKFIRRNISTLYFMTMQPVQEAILGKVDSATGISFTELEINGLVTGLEWNTNSGNTLYSWSGSSISIGQ